MNKIKRIRRSWPVLAIFAFYIYLAFHALSGSQGLMSYTDYKSDIERLNADLVDIRKQRENLERRIAELRPEHLNRDALDILARKYTFTSDPNEFTIWLDP